MNVVFVIIIIAILAGYIVLFSLFEGKSPNTQTINTPTTTKSHSIPNRKRKRKRRPNINEILDNIDKMKGTEFEQYIKNLLKSSGFQQVEITKATGDFGADIVAYKDGAKYIFQCKRYGKNLGIKPIQEIHTAKRHYHSNYEVVITNSYFTENAKILAIESGVLLYDRNVLSNMIKKNGSELSLPNISNGEIRRATKRADKDIEFVRLMGEREFLYYFADILADNYRLIKEASVQTGKGSFIIAIDGDDRICSLFIIRDSDDVQNLDFLSATETAKKRNQTCAYIVLKMGEISEAERDACKSKLLKDAGMPDDFIIFWEEDSIRNCIINSFTFAP